MNARSHRAEPARASLARGLAVAALVALPAAGRAVEVEDLRVEERSGTWHVDATVRLDAPPEAVVETLVAFDEHTRIAPFILESKVVEDRGAEKLVRVVTRTCVGPFCCAVAQLQRVRVSPGLVHAEALPAESDVHSGATAWEVSASGPGTTRVRMRTATAPVRPPPFFVPDGLVASALRDQARQSAAGVEALARARAGGRAGVPSPLAAEVLRGAGAASVAVADASPGAPRHAPAEIPAAR